MRIRRIQRHLLQVAADDALLIQEDMGRHLSEAELCDALDERGMYVNGPSSLNCVSLISSRDAAASRMGSRQSSGDHAYSGGCSRSETETVRVQTPLQDEWYLLLLVVPGGFEDAVNL